MAEIGRADHPSNGPARRNGNARWMRRAVCRSEDPSIFFPLNEESGSERIDREARAKSICGGCHVRQDCLDFAVRIDIRFGVWGGMNEKERAALRPPATPAARVTS